VREVYSIRRQNAPVINRSLIDMIDFLTCPHCDATIEISVVKRVATNLMGTEEDRQLTLSMAEQQDKELAND
jgi:hypothetical protein